MDIKFHLDAIKFQLRIRDDRASDTVDEKR